MFPTEENTNPTAQQIVNGWDNELKHINLTSCEQLANILGGAINYVQAKACAKTPKQENKEIAQYLLNLYSNIREIQTELKTQKEQGKF